MKARIQRKGTASPRVSLPVIGHVRIGEKVPTANGGERPVSLDYFKATATNAAYTAQFRAAFGEKPVSLPIVFASDDLADVCRHYYELRDNAGKRLAYGDGETFRVATKQGAMVQDVEWTPEQIAAQYGTPEAFMEHYAKQAGKPWKEKLTLRFVLVGVPVIGSWQFDTHGDDTSIPQITGAIDSVIEAAGRLRMIPFDLQVEKVKSDKAGDSRNYPVVKLVCNLSVDSVERLRALPTTGFGLLSNEKIGALTTGADTAPQLAAGTAVDACDDCPEVEYLKADETVA